MIYTRTGHLFLQTNFKRLKQNILIWTEVLSSTDNGYDYLTPWIY